LITNAQTIEIFENTHVTEYLGGLRAGDEVTTNADDSVGIGIGRALYITALC
jgi:hypothetical protein